ncbi:unnamed protein product [Polarella glacialis]|uniref:DUF6817 domain-containing protein n=1 Tax=Polarella glacialis TaxID=89957 RepID=A0A813ERA2_POLGL|nr:unnamed protein product [Polarella glacialis]
MGSHDAGDFATLPPVIHAMIHEDDVALDPAAERFLTVLKRSAAPEIWHKHGHFYSHLHDVWQMLCAWGQPQAICRLGLFHSAYSNSFVSMNLFNPDTEAGRAELRDLVGEDAENLIYKFCVINRQEMETEVLRTGRIPEEGRSFKHIRTGEPVMCSASEIGAFIVETLADYQDQSFGWQSDMEAGLSGALWPGICKPTLRMSKVSKMAVAVRKHGQLKVVPPIFDHCSKVLDESDERAARDLYWRVLSGDTESPGGLAAATSVAAEAAIADLLEASKLNPFVAEPHAVRAQLLVQKGRWPEAAEACKAALRLFYEWATQWDNRMPFVAWVSWTRCILLQTSFKEWPTTHGGVESLGAVHPSQRFRKLNTGRDQPGDEALEDAQAGKKARV